MSGLVSYLTVNCCRESGDADCLTDCGPQKRRKSRNELAA
jgi:hypothetical protein